VTRAFALAAIVVLATLAGCRTAPPAGTATGPGADAPWPAQRAALEKLDRYALNGKVAVAANGQGFTASLRYQQQPQRADLALDGPLGIGGMRIVLGEHSLAVTNSRGEALDGAAARDEIERRLGLELPLDALRWWLLGLPAPGPSEVDAAPGGEIRGFVQSGWRVSINARAPALGFALPQRVLIERAGAEGAGGQAMASGGARVKLFVERWQP
jgi:outer membrane lipoprotein LolB